MAIDDSTARTLLVEERRRIETARATVEGDLEEERSGADDELAAYDQHPAEQGTEVEDMSRDLGLRDDFDTLLAENEAAMARVDAGTYGTCEICGRPIGDERLTAMPSTRYCLEHQKGAPSESAARR